MGLMTRSRFWLWYTAIVAVVLASEVTNLEAIEFVAKPLLMPGLLFYLFSRTRGVADLEALPFVRRVEFGLIFSWFGDILLMFSGQDELFFMGGLVAFLLAHFFYISAYLYSIWTAGEPESRCYAPFFRRRPWWIVPFVLLLIGLYGYLFPNLGSMRLPVLIYAVTILTMAALALNRKGCVGDRSFWPVLVGSMLFVVSDALIAVNRFATSVPKSGLIIMTSYIAAQYLIVEGAIAEGAGAHRKRPEEQG
ncbi:MAG: lysoplasmalogenase [Spirochaetaceae bacterium]